MSRHGGSTAGRGLPVYQIEVQDYRSKGSTSFLYLQTEKGKKQIDVLSNVCRTLVHRCADYEAAKRWGSRFGTVIKCFKVDTSPYIYNIEHLNLRQEPVHIQMDKEEYILNKALELSNPHTDYDKKLDMELVDKE